MFRLRNEVIITIESIPLPWIPKIELYYPDLPQFPMIYINTYVNKQRILACPVAVSYQIGENSCDAIFTVLTNVELSETNKDKIKSELSERIGYSKKISKSDVIDCCNGNEQYIALFTDLWDYIQSSYGEFVPYGKFYEEIFSIIRFVAAWQPKTGRQSEMRMLYNFMSAFGEKIELTEKWSHLEFYAIPNLYDISNNDFSEFPKFSTLESAMRKLFDKYFVKKVKIDGIEFKVMERAWKQNKDSFILNVTDPMFSEGILSESEKLYAETLVDAFNRHAWRAAYFISAYMNIKNDYSMWTKQFFINFYENGNKLKGYSEKVIACFLQQGFLNPEVIPIDTWIKTFYEFPLGIDSNAQFFNMLSKLGKLERIIWLSSQSNKTNMKTFFNILWCQRYGTTGNGELRGINPISCYSCQLKKSCVGVSKKRFTNVKLLNNSSEEDLSTIFAEKPEIAYICLLNNGVPKKCYIRKRDAATLVDEFSGYILTAQNKLSDDLLHKDTITFEEFVFSKNINLK
ncbi:hypothetical protein [Alkalihalobacillus trypoxylicola]|uniref:Uncharacterized protein n=1 Tax=Alkalihalobacillus trypoxylicola TaxID=519424 RepID=A0A161PZL8_9BACI|nr:hypothetical protein [Alkalihalobacillus trypoxylicola]KYG28195.1 hypothetical protein AZF04_09855 [Alkalihalobacillus trypoxylicola]